MQERMDVYGLQAPTCEHCDGEGTEVVVGDTGYVRAPCSFCASREARVEWLALQELARGEYKTSWRIFDIEVDEDGDATMGAADHGHSSNVLHVVVRADDTVEIE